MALFQRLVWAALAVALTIGSVQTALQQWQAAPIIRAAERFEDAKPAPAMHDHQHGDGHGDGAAPAAWSPADGLERTGWSWVANVLNAFSMALLMLAAMGGWVWRRGAAASPMRLALLTAAAGWLSLHLWPSLGLPAEIPGMDAARLGSRQGWWVLAAGCAVLACVSAAALRSRWRWLAAVAWLAVPYAVGAPHIAADPFGGFAPDAQMQLRLLDEQFVRITAVLSLTLWGGLGLGCGAVFGRWLQPLLARSAATPRRATVNAG